MHEVCVRLTLMTNPQKIYSMIDCFQKFLNCDIQIRAINPRLNSVYTDTSDQSTTAFTIIKLFLPSEPSSLTL